jgi:hypothetical protein
MKPKPLTTLASRIAPGKVEWLWPDRVPFGKLSVLAGDPAAGKTTLALDLAARLSTGRRAPGDQRLGGTAQSALILSAEDGAADVLVPRLIAAQANLKRVRLRELHELLTLPDDVDALSKEIARFRIGLVVLDPLSAFLGSSSRTSGVRRALASVAGMAEDTGAAVLGIEHLNKSASKSPLHRVLGSVAVTGAARVVLVAGRDPDDATRFLLGALKTNLAPLAPSLAYRLVVAKHATHVEWAGVSPRTATEILASPQHGQGSALERAERYLTETLSKGEALMRDIEALARKHGIAGPTLQRAKRALGVQSQRREDQWWWRLRSPTDTNVIPFPGCEPPPNPPTDAPPEVEPPHDHEG